MKNYRIKPWLPGLEKSRKTWKRNNKWSNLDRYRCCTSILVIALEINYQFGRKFTNHNNGRSIIIGRRAISRVFHLWIKSREIESSSQCSICFNIEPERNTRLVFLIIVNDLEGSDLRGPSVRKSGYPLLWLGGEGGGAFRASATLPPAEGTISIQLSQDARCTHPTLYYIYNPCAWHAVTCRGYIIHRCRLIAFKPLSTIPLFSNTRLLSPSPDGVAIESKYVRSLDRVA